MPVPRGFKFPKIVATGKHVCQGDYSLKDEQGIVKKKSEESVLDKYCNAPFDLEDCDA